MLRRQELAKKNQGKEKEQPTSTFLQSGTVVNGPRYAASTLRLPPRKDNVAASG